MGVSGKCLLFLPRASVIHFHVIELSAVILIPRLEFKQYMRIFGWDKAISVC